jgi:hypothetical protein
MCRPNPKKGTKLPVEEIRQRTQTRRAKYDGHYVSEAKRAQQPNPAYEGRAHSPRANAAGGTRADLGRYFRSRWEANFARYLNVLRRRWIYEPGEFALQLDDGATVTYRPDFLVDDAYFVELKGFRQDAALPVLLAASTQLQKPLCIIRKAQYQALEKRIGHTICGWEFPGSARPTDTPHLCPTCANPTKRLTQKYCSRKCQPHPFTGRKLSADAIQRRTATRLKRYGGYWPKKDAEHH